jgi:hypothetical protein
MDCNPVFFIITRTNYVVLYMLCTDCMKRTHNAEVASCSSVSPNISVTGLFYVGKLLLKILSELILVHIGQILIKPTSPKAQVELRQFSHKWLIPFRDV